MSINEVLGRDPANPQTFGNILASNIESFIQPIVSPTLTNVLTSGNTAGGLDINATGSSVIASHIKTSSLEGQSVLETIEITNPLKATNLATIVEPLSKILYMDDATKDIKSGDAPQQNIDYADFKYFIKNDVKSRYGLNNTLAVPTDFQPINEVQLQTAINSTATYKLIKISGDIFLTAPLTITRPVYIYADSPNISIRSTTIPNFLIVQSDNVIFDNVGLQQDYAANESNCINVNLGNSNNQMVAFVDCVFRTSEFAITGSWNNLFVLSTQFIPLELDSHRYIYPSTISGLTIFDSCSFEGTGNNTRIIQIDSANSSWKGCKFVLSNCSTYLETNCSQVMETSGLPFPAGDGFELYLINNNFKCSNGAVIFVQDLANLSGIRALYGYNNTITMVGLGVNNSKGLFAFAIGSSLQVPSSILYYMKGNILIDANLRNTYSDITIVQNKTIAVSYTPYAGSPVSLDLKDLHYLQSDLLISNFANINEADINVLDVGRIKPTQVISRIHPADSWIALSVGDENNDNGGDPPTTQPPTIGDRVVMGNLGTQTAGAAYATIGAHSHQLNQWRDLYINPSSNVSAITYNLQLINGILNSKSQISNDANGFLLQVGNTANPFHSAFTASADCQYQFLGLGSPIVQPKLQLRLDGYHHNIQMIYNDLYIDARGNNNQFGNIIFKVGTGNGGSELDSRRSMDMVNDGRIQFFDITGNNVSATFWYNAPSVGGVPANVVDFTYTAIGTVNRGYWYLNDSGFYGSTSDKRIKKNIRYLDVDKSYNFIKKLKPCVFNHINKEQDVLGFVAQDVLSACETEGQHLIVNGGKYYLDYKATHDGKEPDERLGVSQTAMIPELICAFQSAIKDIDELKTKLNQSETKYSELETKLLLLEQKFNEFLKQPNQSGVEGATPLVEGTTPLL